MGSSERVVRRVLAIGLLLLSLVSGAACAAVITLQIRSHPVCECWGFADDRRSIALWLDGGEVWLSYADGGVLPRYRGSQHLRFSPHYRYSPVRDLPQDTWVHRLGVWYHEMNGGGGFTPRFLTYGTIIYEVAVPLWPLAVMTAFPVVGTGWRAWRRFGRRSSGSCARCGYDLRATPERCPECGQTTAADDAASPSP